MKLRGVLYGSGASRLPYSLGFRSNWSDGGKLANRLCPQVNLCLAPSSLFTDAHQGKGKPSRLSGVSVSGKFSGTKSFFAGRLAAFDLKWGNRG